MDNIKIIEVYVESKRSKNYQTETVGLRATITKEKNKERTVKILQEQANRLALEALNTNTIK